MVAWTLIGWCTEKDVYLLIYTPYEFMPNGSLDTHLFGKRPHLCWDLRYKVALGLASALFYLHEEWDRCVLQRDNKASKIILDTNFNVKLCDFGLARLMDYDIGSHTTGLARTFGHIWLLTGRANKSKESDIYSFGVSILKSHKNALRLRCFKKKVFQKKNALRLRVLLKECGLGSVWKTTTFVSYGEKFGEEYNKEQADRILLL